MSLTQDDLLGLDYSWRGLPYNQTAATPPIDTTTLDYAWRGVPYSTEPAPAATSGASSFFLFFP